MNRLFSKLLLSGLMLQAGTTIAYSQDAPRAEVEAFVDNFWTEWSQPNSIALPFIVASVTETSEFYGKPISRADYAKIQRTFAIRWPLRSYSLEPGTLTVTCDPDGLHCMASGVVDWVASSPARNVTSKGKASFDFDIQLPAPNSSDAIIISAQDGHVLSRTITTYEPASADDTKTGGSPSAQPPSGSPAASAPVSAPPAVAIAPQEPPTPPPPSFANTVSASDLAGDNLKVTSWSTEWAVDEQSGSGEQLCVPVVRLTLQNLGADLPSPILQVQFVDMAKKTIFGESIGSNAGIQSGFSADFVLDGDTGFPVDGLSCLSPPLLTAIVKISDYPPGSGNDLVIGNGLVDPTPPQ